jgi:hypothetical protein
MRLHAIGKDGDMKQAKLILVILTALWTALLHGQHLPAQQEIAPLQIDSTRKLGSAVPVILGSVVTGTAVFAGYAFLNFWCDECPGPRSGIAVYSAGATTGALIGAGIGKRKAAFGWTVLGAAVATVPLIIWTPEEEWSRGIPTLVFALPVTGALIGNTIGQFR